MLNILGLALSTAVFLLIIRYVQFEFSYEKDNPKAAEIYRVTYDYYSGSAYQGTDCETHPPLAPLLKQEIPEVVDYVRVQMMEDNNEINYKNQIYKVDRLYAADPSVFRMFNYQLVKGDTTGFDKPFQAILTETQAKRIFGNEDPIGKVVLEEDRLFTVSGVMKDSPANTHLKVDMLISFSTLKAMGWAMDAWNGNNNYTYVQLQPRADLQVFNAKLKHISHVTLKGRINDGNLFTAEPIQSIHLYSRNKSYEPETNGDAKTVKFLLITGILILLVGAVNYVNLTTAKATERFKEIGLRKLLGSSRAMLVKQLLMETLLVNVLAMMLAVIITWMALPFYIQLIDRPLPAELLQSFDFWMLCLGLLLFNYLISGIYPAMRLSDIQPIKVVGRTFTESVGGSLFRKILVVGQFATAMMVLAATYIVYQQLNYLRQQDLGMNPAQVLIVRGPKGMPDSTSYQSGQLFKQQLLQLPMVEEVAISGAVPGVPYHEVSTNNGITRFGTMEGAGRNYTLYGFDEHFIAVNGMELAAGSNFQHGSANEDKVLVNETAAKLLGFTDPTRAVGQRISHPFYGSAKFVTIVGVMKDFHQLSLKEATLPLIHWYGAQGNFYSVKLATKDISKTIQSIEQIWKGQFQGYPFDYNFLNTMFDQQYKTETRFGEVVGVFSGLTLFITCLGVLGLISYTITKKTKEIGIRKVLGASVSEIVQLLSFDFLKLVIIAMFIATPIAWYVMNDWLDDFAYRMEIRWWIFLVVGIGSLFITLAVLSIQSIKAAWMNPVRSLRSE